MFHRDWLKSIGETARAKSAGELATLATESLSFTVSAGNVAGMRTQLGLNPGQGACQRRTKVHKVTAERLTAMTEVVSDALKAAITAQEALARAKDHLLSIHRSLEKL